MGFVDKASQAPEEGKQTDTIIFGFAKAFHKMSHQLLLHKLQRFGITRKTHSWMQDFLTNTEQVVVVEEVRFTFKPVLAGVPQGSVLEPNLLLFFINNLPASNISI